MMASASESVSDAQLEESFVTLVDALTAHVERWQRNPHSRSYQVVDLDFSQWRVWASLSDHVDVAPALTLTHFHEISEMPEAQHCAELHLSAGLQLPEATPYGVPLESLDARQKRLYLLDELLTLAGTVIGAAPSGRPTREAIVTSYREALRGWRDPNIVWEMVAPITNIRSDLAGRSRFDVLELRRLSAEEKSRLWRTFSFPFSFGVFDVTLLQGAVLQLCGHYSYGRDDEARYHVGLGVARDVLTALRLHKPGLIGISNYFEVLCQPASPSFMSRSSSFRDETLTVPHWDNAYVLRVAELSAVRTLYNRLRVLRALPHEAGLSFALRSFNQSYSRQRIEDRLVDLTVVLESAVLTDIIARQHKWLPLRLELLLGPRRGASAVPLGKFLYHVRSLIMHEGYSMAEVPDDKEARQLLRKVTPTLSLDDGGGEFHARTQAMVRLVMREYLRRVPRAGSTAALNIRLDARIPKGDHPGVETIRSRRGG